MPFVSLRAACCSTVIGALGSLPLRSRPQLCISLPCQQDQPMRPFEAALQIPNNTAGTAVGDRSDDFALGGYWVLLSLWLLQLSFPRRPSRQEMMGWAAMLACWRKPSTIITVSAAALRSRDFMASATLLINCGASFSLSIAPRSRCCAAEAPKVATAVG
jgi:hypothetical protein